jgi:hypothetical protein
MTRIESLRLLAFVGVVCAVYCWPPEPFFEDYAGDWVG